MAALLQSTSAISTPYISLSDENKTTQRELLKLSRSPTGLDSLLNRNPQAWNKLLGSWRSFDHPWLVWLGLQVIFTCYGNSLHTSYFFSGKIGLWELFGLRAICFNLGLRTFPLGSLGFSILGATLSLRNVVPETSEIMIACQNGDVRAVRDLFLSRRATPYDVTPENSGVMRVSIS